ncbi:MAG: hypothetical protein Solumvirus6_19 [Solumvirus sp.]|uniref:Uncharacterized protein n=1 Tax=Solumvirus sp. TaxID=2487773 RepID=A0A3G5AIG4_9VIRU|nr:MAG: hypothetical protein Solumvirus6_19 [Solumvirus sp.]
MLLEIGFIKDLALIVIDYVGTDLLIDYEIPILEDNIKKVNWTALSKNHSLPECFFEKYHKKVKWGHLCLNPFLSVSFFERHIEKIKWVKISENTGLPESFFDTHFDRLTKTKKNSLKNLLILLMLMDYVQIRGYQRNFLYEILTSSMVLVKYYIIREYL